MIETLPINRLPGGLLGALDIKSLGRNPQKLDDQLKAVWESRDLYVQTPMSRAFDNNVNLAVVGQVPTNLVVPTGKMWFVLQAALVSNAVLGAATTIRARLSVSESNGAFVMFGGPQQATVGEQLIATMGIGDGFLMFAGHQLNVFVESFAGVAALSTVSVRRLEVDI